MPVEERAVAKPKKQNLILENRRQLSVSGVYNVGKFNESMITLDTELGTLSIKGSGLKLKKVDIESGIAEIEGTINALDYLNNKAPKASKLLPQFNRQNR